MKVRFFNQGKVRFFNSLRRKNIVLWRIFAIATLTFLLIPSYALKHLIEYPFLVLRRLAYFVVDTLSELWDNTKRLFLIPSIYVSVVRNVINTKNEE